MLRAGSAFPHRALGAAFVAASLAVGCAWDPWIPGERSWNPDIVVEPGDLSEQLALDAPYVGRLDCYARSCEKRFRLVVDRPGELTLSAVPQLASPDDQARMVLEGFQGVLARAASGRGPRGDVTVLAVRQPVQSGVYFVLMQSLGGPVPFQLTAHLAPSAGAPGPGSVVPAAPAATPPPGPPRALVDAQLPSGARGGYDPSLDWARLRTFRFAPPAGSGEGHGSRVEAPIDRQIRYLIASDLGFKGLRQASGREPAALEVDFSRRSRNTDLGWLRPIYDQYYFPVAWNEVETRATLTVDIVDLRTNRLAWHAQTTKGIGPGITPGEAGAALLREAVNEVLAGFPPRGAP